MSTRSTRRRARTECQRAALAAVALLVLASIGWLVTVPAGYQSHPLNAAIYPLFIFSMATSFGALFCTAWALEAGARS